LAPLKADGVGFPHPVKRLVSIDLDGTDQLALWVAACAVPVLPFFHENQVSDERRQRAIAASRAWPP
jgi:hypothetical protein